MSFSMYIFFRTESILKIKHQKNEHLIYFISCHYFFLFDLSKVNMSTAPEQATKPSGDWSRLLLNKVVIITGAGGGIGSAIAETCALHGAYVVIADVNKKAADEVAAKIINDDETRKEYVMPIELDVSDDQAIQNAVQAVVDKWKTVDVLVNKYVDYLIK